MFGKPAFPMNGTPRSIELTQKIEMAVQRGSAGIGFSEIMAGFIHSGPDVGDFRASTELARRNCETARFFLTARSWDTQECKHLEIWTQLTGHANVNAKWCTVRSTKPTSRGRSHRRP